MAYTQQDSRCAKASRPQSNSIVERVDRTLLGDHVRVKSQGTRLKIVEKIRASLDRHLESNDTKRPHQGLGLRGRTPLKPFGDGIPSRKEKT